MNLRQSAPFTFITSSLRSSFGVSSHHSLPTALPSCTSSPLVGHRVTPSSQTRHLPLKTAPMGWAVTYQTTEGPRCSRTIMIHASGSSCRLFVHLLPLQHHRFAFLPSLPDPDQSIGKTTSHAMSSRRSPRRFGFRPRKDRLCLRVPIRETGKHLLCGSSALSGECRVKPFLLVKRGNH
jgi:hypothetical protein